MEGVAVGRAESKAVHAMTIGLASIPSILFVRLEKEASASSPHVRLHLLHESVAVVTGE